MHVVGKALTRPDIASSSLPLHLREEPDPPLQFLDKNSDGLVERASNFLNALHPQPS
jgi:hypothetical protein